MTDKDWIGDIYTSKMGWSVLKKLVEFSPRMGASEGEYKSHQMVLDRFDSFGLRNLTEQTYSVPYWERSESSLTLDRPRSESLDCIALPGSPENQVSGEIVHLGYGLPEDFEKHDVEGKIVVVRSDVPEYHKHWMHRREKYNLAIDHGASAFVYANHIEGCLPPTGSLAGDKRIIGDLVAIGVSKEIGARLQRYCQDGHVEGTLEVSPKIHEDGESQNTIGELGPDTDSVLVVGAHIDGHDINQSAIDNGAGVAILTEIAQSLSRREDCLETKVKFVAFGCEEYGLVGSQFYVDQFKDETKAILNCDGVGRGRTSLIYTNYFPAFEEPVQRVADEFNNPIRAVPQYILHSDHWPFVWNGIPGAMASSKSPESGRGYGHTYADTLDKVDPRDIREHSIILTRLVELLARDQFQPEPKTAEQIRKHLVEKGDDEYLKRANDWPY